MHLERLLRRKNGDTSTQDRELNLTIRVFSVIVGGAITNFMPESLSVYLDLGIWVATIVDYYVRVRKVGLHSVILAAAFAKKTPHWPARIIPAK